MFEITENFRMSVEKGFNEYQSQFIKKNLTERRASDLLNLRRILHNEYHNINQCIDRLNVYLDTMGTGWWIFQTGNSVLKGLTRETIDRYKDPIIQEMLLDASKSASELNRLSEFLKQAQALSKQDLSEAKTAQLIDMRLYQLRDDYEKRKQEETVGFWASGQTFFSERPALPEGKKVPAGRPHLNCHLMARII